MLATLLVAMTTFFATIGPHDVAVVFAALTPNHSSAARRKIAFKAVAVSAIVLVFFAFLGNPILSGLGITLAALRTAGGILLLLVAIDLVFARMSGGTSTTQEENDEAAGRADISVFPLATPLIAGPGAIGAAILLVAEAGGDPLRTAAVIAGMAAVLGLTLSLMLAATLVQKYLGMTGAHVLSRVFGILLASLAVQFLFDGIKQSGLL